MGTFDTPAVIDYILAKTNRKNLAFVGHSEGTTQIMAGAALMPEYYTAKLYPAVFLAPPASLFHMKNGLMRALSHKDLMEPLGNLAYELNILNWGPEYKRIYSDVLLVVCNISPKICGDVIAWSTDTDITTDNMERLDTYVSWIPSGASMYDFMHYG